MLLVNDLHFSIETWDDPGPFESPGAPLPSYDYPVCEGAAYFDCKPTMDELNNLVEEGFGCVFHVSYIDEVLCCDEDSYPDYWKAIPNLDTLVLEEVHGH